MQVRPQALQRLGGWGREVRPWALESPLTLSVCLSPQGEGTSARMSERFLKEEH